MCYLVTFKERRKGVDDIWTRQEPFRNDAEAKSRAEVLATSDGISEVQLWKLVGEPKIKKTVEWNAE